MEGRVFVKHVFPKITFRKCESFEKNKFFFEKKTKIEIIRDPENNFPSQLIKIFIIF